MDFGDNFGDIVLWTLWFVCFIAFFMALWFILSDLFGDASVGGWGKFWWCVFIIFLPFLGMLVYVIARGRGMAERRDAKINEAKAQADAYIRQVTGSAASPTDQIASAKALLDSGAITQAEFDTLKAKALAD